MIVVSDSTPLITLMKGMRLDILQGLFGDVLIPDAVYDEVTRNAKFQKEAKQIMDCAFIKKVSVKNLENVVMLQRATGLDRGESEAIIYADENHADVLLMDEEAGRKVAMNMKLPLAGSMGVIIQAKKAGFLSADEADEVLDRIEQSSVHISKRLLQDVRDIIHDEKQ
jgi:hypothetical protein